ncbi:NADH dehydrogenase [ubiquinone] 1 beta subcomplex subunit 7-like protein [Leptotrombidium deliense]|uniref:NADH dehydrogenase [ubiquinone] 1 beta subcomplex subunit 7 n=1 Tax=Leptotrombidium deliense TaxID=299467 RepID=A0A443SNN4_9ACAR|nr:NADH dehydrogenase [ubiquinone] 1 beta subcomplex subunit 7-like protein [Leptotrombidium deliense]
MGNDISFGHLKSVPDPDCTKESKYDPLFGFPKGRKVREMIATPEELDSARVPSEHRDYCAHMYIKLMACRRDEAPFFGRCDHHHHAWLTCQYEDEVMRMKEWEREKRLDIRQRRLIAKMKSEGQDVEIPVAQR